MCFNSDAQVTLGDQTKFVGWSEKTSDPHWHSGVYFAVSYEIASSRRKGLSFSLYNNKGCFGAKKLVAKHEFDPGRITFYEAFGPSWIPMMTTGKNSRVYGQIQVKVQYVRGSDYFTCPTCPRLTDHTPIFLFGNIASVTLKKESQLKKGVKVVAKCKKQTETTPVDKAGEFQYHFMWDYQTIKKAKEVVFFVYKKGSKIGKVTVKLDDLLEGNLCEWSKPIMHGKNEVGTLFILLQSIYECSECIVEREDEDGEVDIPSKPVVQRPAQPEVQLTGVIPGMSSMTPAATPAVAPAVAPADLASVASIPGMAPSGVVAVTPLPVNGVPCGGAVPVTPYSVYPSTTPVAPVQVTPVGATGGVFPSTVSVSVQPLPGMGRY